MTDTFNYDLCEAADSDSLLALIATYIEWLHIKNYAGTTTKLRKKSLARFAYWCYERGIIRPVEITKQILQRYQRHLYRYRKANGEPLSFNSQSIHLVAIRSFFKWLSKDNYIPYNPAADLELPKLGKRLPKYVLTAKEVEQILNEPDVTTAIGIRDRSIIETLYSTGIRRTELINLSIFDLNIAAGTLMIRAGKGNKDRMVPIGDRAVLWIEKYLADIRPQMILIPTDTTLFISNMGESMSPDHLTRIVGKYVKASGVNKPGACHIFRHTMATLMLENGADIRFIQHILGHAVLNTTQIYTHVSIKKLKEIHTATHPAKMKSVGKYL
jgi:integrase/recombinase XerD